MGRLICFEGVNFAGKSNAVDLTERFLKQRGKTCHVIKFPTNSELGKLAYEITARGFLTDSEETERTFLHLADMLEWQGVIGTLLRSSDFVLIDRYWYTSHAYNYVKGLDIRVFGRTYLTHPDKIIYLNYDVKRLPDRKIRAKNVFEENLDNETFEDLMVRYSQVLAYERQRVLNVDTTDRFPDENDIESWLKEYL